MSAQKPKHEDALGVVTASDGKVSVQQRAADAAVSVKGQGERETTDAPSDADSAAAPSPREAADPSVMVTEDLDFEALMAAQAGASERAFEPGDKVKGIVEVVSLHGQEVFLDLGGKATGYILKEELRNEEGELTVKQGDELEGIVVGTNSNGVHIRMRLGQDGNLRQIREAHSAGLPVEGKILSTNKGGYEVLVAGQRAFCPHSQIDVYRLEDPESVVGQVHSFKITEIRPGSVVVSRAALLRAEQAKRAAETMEKIKVGARLPGRVRSIQKFGAFVDLGGIDGLVHVSELSWGRVNDPHEVVKLGQEVEVVVVEIDPSRERIALSMKAAQSDPFETALEGLQVGASVSGTVARLTNFGAFVTLADNVDGLIHISDLAHHRVRHPKEVLSVGDNVTVKVTEVDLERHRIGLSLKALSADPWDDVAARYKPGQAVKGKVESVQAFGVFIVLETGVTALLPASESGVPQGKPLATEFRVGTEVEAKVLRVDAEQQKMALTRRDDADRRSGRGHGGGGRRDDRRAGRDGGRGGRPGGVAYRDTVEKATDDEGREVGSLGALLLAAMKKDDK